MVAHYDPATDAAHAAWSAAYATWQSVSAAHNATTASIFLSVITIIIAISSIWFSSQLQRTARKQRLSASYIGIYHTVHLYGGIIDTLSKAPSTEPANYNLIANMCEPGRMAIDQVLSNSLDDSTLYAIGVNMQTVIISILRHIDYLRKIGGPNQSNASFKIYLETLVTDIDQRYSDLETARQRLGLKPLETRPYATRRG